LRLISANWTAGDDYDDKLTTLRTKLKDYQGRPVTEARIEVTDQG